MLNWKELEDSLRRIGVETCGGTIVNFGLEEALRRFGIEKPDRIENFEFFYNGYPLGYHRATERYVVFFTGWVVDTTHNHKYSPCNKPYICGNEVGTINVGIDNFNTMSIEDVVNFVSTAKNLLQMAYPFVDVMKQTKDHGVMRSERFIVFEGVDNSGKTTVSKEIQKMMPWFTWTKEPVFSTEQADRLNSDEYKGKDAKREVLFLESRLSQQNLYKENPCLLDRYLWTGLAYAKAFSPSIYSFAEALYTNHNIFKKPDLYIFMDTPLESCYDREPALKKEPGRLERIRQAYRDTEHLIDTPIEYIDGSKSLAECIDEVKTVIVNHFPDQVVVK